MTATDGLVWYACYGSNLLRARFMTYIVGGQVPHSPVERWQDGARDPSPPLDERQFKAPHRLFFAGSTRAWGNGGVAFLDPDPDPGADPDADANDDRTTLCRIWLITIEQLADVTRQENLLAADTPVEVEVAHIVATGHADVADGWYRRLLYLGDGPGDRPIITITCHRADQLPEGPAHQSYLRVIGLGLIEGCGLDSPSAATYLATRDGNTGLIDEHTLAADLAQHRR